MALQRSAHPAAFARTVQRGDTGDFCRRPPYRREGPNDYQPQKKSQQQKPLRGTRLQPGNREGSGV
jgi:hypothetical protein